MFPISHLYIAGRILSARDVPENAAAAFLLGSIAPDAVQFRDGFVVSQKLVTHLCPDNGEAWGRVTANDLWMANVTRFAAESGGDPFMLGYAAHIIGDIFNNVKIWTPFRMADPVNAEKGHSSVYYEEVARVDTRLYYERMKGGWELRLLAEAEAVGLPGLVTRAEVNTIREGLLYPNRPFSYPDRAPQKTGDEIYIPWEKLLSVSEEAAEFALPILFPDDKMLPR